MHAEAVIFDFMQPLVPSGAAVTSCVNSGFIHSGSAARPAAVRSICG
jgi:hypothetical protein